MIFVRFVLAAIAMLVSSHVAAQGWMYEHRGPHHRFIIGGNQQQQPTLLAPAHTVPYHIPPIGGQVVFACDNGGIPVVINGQGMCRYGHTLVPGRTVNHVQHGGGYVNPGIVPSYNQPRTHAGSVPVDAYGRCPNGMVPSPRTPEQLPGCW